jgi:aspartyl-tRNA(Asn)/glutamyl-tRNA(Gln) amidotransferase subunit A
MRPHYLTRRQFTRALTGAAGAVAAHRLSPAAFGFARSAASSSSASGAGVAGMSLAEASAKIRSGAVTSVELTNACLERIQIYNPKLFAFITVMRRPALAQAAQLDAEAKAGKFRSPLHGVPVAVKDNMDTAGVRTTAGSAVFDDRVPDQDAVVVARLKNAGAVILGKTNLDEFAWAVSYFGSVRNPWALDHDPSGSSSGSAASVASNLAFAALGSDTGGSIRAPASYCGLVGMKATYGLVPIRGIVPLSVSLDHCGPLTRTVEDCALMLDEVAGYDKRDITSENHPKESYSSQLRQPVSGFRIGIPRAPFFDYIDGETLRVVDEAILVLEKLTAGIHDVVLPSTSKYTWGNLNGIGAEIYAYHEDLFEKNPGRYMLSTRQDIQGLKDWLNTPGVQCSSRVTEYIRGRWDMAMLRRTVDNAFTDFDLVVIPSMQIVPRKLSDQIRTEEAPKPTNPGDMDFREMTAFNVLGIPAMSVPCGFSKDGLPIGITIAGPHFSEGKIFALGYAYEQLTKWDTHRPVLTPDTPVPDIRPKES